MCVCYVLMLEPSSLQVRHGVWPSWLDRGERLTAKVSVRIQFKVCQK